MKSEIVWVLKQNDLIKSADLECQMSISSIMAKLLVIRGVDSAFAAHSFINSSLELLSDPFELSGIDKAVKRIKTAIESNEKILVYGDYDADGICSTALLVEQLRKIDGLVDYFIPNRFIDGYGLNQRAIEELFNLGCNLLITVDCGISSYDEVALAV